MKRTGLLCIILLIIFIIGCYLYNNYLLKQFRSEKEQAIALAVKHAIDSVNQRHALQTPEKVTEVHKPPKVTVKPKAVKQEPVKKKSVLIDERDGQEYPIDEINGTIWMTANLNYKTDESWCYDNDDNECTTNGRLYTWKAAMNACPDGWELPDDKAWSSLFNYYGGVHYAGKSLKKEGGSGFNVLYSGYRDKAGYFGKLNESAYFWSSTEQSDLYASFKGIYNTVDNIGTYTYPKNDGFSVRCIKKSDN